MKESYALFILNRELQVLIRDTQLRGPGEGVLVDTRFDKINSITMAIETILEKPGTYSYGEKK